MIPVILWLNKLKENLVWITKTDVLHFKCLVGFYNRDLVRLKIWRLWTIMKYQHQTALWNLFLELCYCSMIQIVFTWKNQLFVRTYNLFSNQIRIPPFNVKAVTIWCYLLYFSWGFLYCTNNCERDCKT